MGPSKRDEDLRDKDVRIGVRVRDSGKRKARD